MSPPLVVAFALAGRADWDVHQEPVGRGSDGKPVYLKDIWPSQKEVDDAMKSVSAQMFRETYSEVFKGSEQWQKLPIPEGDTYQWEPDSTYIRNPPYFDGMQVTPPQIADIVQARVLAMLGDSVTTDHISPAGSIKADSPAGKYLLAHKVEKSDFNSYGARRGNHEVMMRGTFANTRLKNKLIPHKEGPYTRHLPDGKETTIFEAAEQYRQEKVPVIILAGKEYGSGSSRDWAAKGPLLLGTRAVIAESFERIHRSNLIGMGILPLQFPAGQTPESLGLSGEEAFDITGIRALIDNFKAGQQLTVKARKPDGKTVQFEALVRIDTPQEAQYFRHGGILHYVLRQLLQDKQKPVTAH
jgi:aconitate hydratase